MSLISVIVPVYKVEKYLSRCVESILKQSFRDFDLILIDDGSPDESPVLCDSYAAENKIIHVIHQENGGLSAARNAGIDWVLKNSSSQWITFIDSDDWVHPQYLEALYTACCNVDCKVGMCGFSITSEFRIDDGNPLEHISVRESRNAFRDESLDPSSACGRLYRKELFSDVRFPVGRLHEDAFITYKLLFLYREVAVVDFNLYYYYVNPESIVHSRWTPRRLDCLDAMEQQIAFFRNYGDNDLYEYVVRRYMAHCVTFLRWIREIPEYASYEKLLRGKLRLALRKNKKKLNLTYSTDKDYFKYAYPFRFRLLRKLGAIKVKFFNLLNCNR